MLSDDGETLAMLFVSGLSIDRYSPLFQVIEQIAQDHSVTFEQETLSVYASEEILAQKVSALIHAIQSVGFLIYRRIHRKKPTFKDKVEALILQSEVIYTPDYTIRGNANTHKFDFYINVERNLLIDALNATNVSTAREKVKKSAYKYLDLQAGNVPHQCILVIDDRHLEHLKAWEDKEIQNTFHAYFAHTTFFWSSGQQHLVSTIKGQR